MDAKIIRSAVYSTTIFLLVGLVFGTFGGWTPIFKLTSNIFGAIILALIFNIFLAYIYYYWFNNFLPGTAAIRGALFGSLVWIFFLVLGGLSSFFKEAVYPASNSSVIFLSLVLQIIWGSSLNIFLENKN